MSDIATKLQYLNTTKSKIKDVINMTGVGITNDTFRSYAQALYNGYIATLKDKGTLLDNMNKGTSTGTISGSANLPVYEYKSSKLSTQETTTGKNKLVNSLAILKSRNTLGTWNNNVYTYNGITYTVNDDLSITIGGTYSTRSYFYVSSQNFDVLPNTYILSGCPSGGGTSIYTIVGDIRNGSTFIETWVDTGSGTTKNLSIYETPKLDFYINILSSSAIGKTFYPMVRLSSVSDSSYEPYTNGPAPNPSFPMEVKTVKGYSNLFDEEYYNNASLYSSPSTLFRYFVYVKMPDSFKTKFYGNMTLKGTSQNLVFGFSTSDNGVPSRMLNNGTLTSNVEYDFTNATNVYLIIGNSNDIDIARDIPLIFNNYNIIISKTSDKPYVPYGSNYIYTTITSGNNSRQVLIPLNNNEICGIGDYKDELVIDEYGHAKLTKKIGKVVLDGTQGLLLRNTSANGTYTYSLNTSFEYKIEENASIFSNYFNSLGTVIGVSKMYDDYLDILGIALYYNSSSLSTRVVYINSDVDLTTWLTTHNTDVYYVLATPIEIDLGTVDMELYEGTNNITNSEDMDMSIRFIKSDFE